MSVDGVADTSDVAASNDHNDEFGAVYDEGHPVEKYADISRRQQNDDSSDSDRQAATDGNSFQVSSQLPAFSDGVLGDILAHVASRIGNDGPS